MLYVELLSYLRGYCNAVTGGDKLRDVLRGIEAGKEAEQGIVIQHLLEMRHKPLAIYGVVVKTASKLVIDASSSHLFQGETHYL